jgi:anthranilate synthase component II
MRILVLDNHDSFTWNLVHLIEGAGARAEVVRSDAVSPAEAIGSGADAFLVSPGPGGPDEAGASRGLVEAAAAAGRPLLGVCLGMQAIARVFGGTVERAPAPVHGKTGPIRHDGSGLFAGLPSPFEAVRYHSLCVGRLGGALVANAWAPDGTVQGLRHARLPIHGVQFHPESVASQYGAQMVGAFLSIAAATAARAA